MKIESHANKVNFVRQFVDMANVSIAWTISYVVRFHSGIITLSKGEDSWNNYKLLMVPMIFCYFTIFVSMGLYKRSVGRRRLLHDHFDVFRCHIFAFMFFVSLSYFIFEHRYSRWTLALFFITCPMTLIIGRSLVRKIDRAYLRRKKERLKAVFIGESKILVRLKELLIARADWNLSLEKSFEAEDNSLDILEISSHIHEKKPDVIFISLGSSLNCSLDQILTPLKSSLADMIVLPDLGTQRFLSSNVGYLGRLPYIALNSSGLESDWVVFKRLFDIVFSLLFIVFFSPIFLLCAILVRISSPGPILYSQERMGLDGKSFFCYKFRGMCENAEVASGPVWATKNDPRVTKIGGWLRKTSLDELPQFFNVLRGEMSVVGPRPERPVFVSQFSEKIPGYMLRHKVKAGITGWAQISGWRGDTSLEKRIECDLWYIQNWTFWLDLKIVILTPFKGLVNKHAY